MKIRFCSFLTIALFLLPALQGAERDSLSLLRTIAEHEALPAKWIETVYTNPATRYYQHCTSLTRISLNGVYGKENEAALLQAGDGYLKGAADVSSWIKLSDRTRLWGNARYTTGKETGVVWNETADFELLYPYVMADSIGGDLSLQEYAFTGGYSGRAGKFTWGIEGATVPHWNIETGILVRRTSSRTSILPAEVPCDWVNMSWEYRSWHKYIAKTTRSTFMPRWVAPISIR